MKRIFLKGEDQVRKKTVNLFSKYFHLDYLRFRSTNNNTRQEEELINDTLFGTSNNRKADPFGDHIPLLDDVSSRDSSPESISRLKMSKQPFIPPSPSASSPIMPSNNNIHNPSRFSSPIHIATKSSTNGSPTKFFQQQQQQHLPSNQSEPFYGIEESANKTTCAICLEDFEEGAQLRSLRCRNEFHQSNPQTEKISESP